MATLITPKQFSPVEDVENIKKACQGFFSSFFFSPVLVKLFISSYIMRMLHMLLI
jgi:hypothetical protein